MTMTVNINKKGLKTLVDISHLDKRHKKAIRNSLFDIGDQSKKLAKKNINNIGKTGKRYSYPFKRLHIASSMGQSPANLTGALRDSVDYNVRGVNEAEFGYAEKAEFPYGRWLELTANRPNIRPVGAKLSQSFINYMVKHFKDSK